jgi:peptidoglycan/LPS O-acetylase OafA/YrhL
MAILIVFLIIISPAAQKIFCLKLSIFFGRISFPLYVIHMTIICSLTSWLITKDYDPNNTKLVLIYFMATVFTSIVSACVLYPVEKISIIISRKIFEYLSGEDKFGY